MAKLGLVAAMEQEAEIEEATQENEVEVPQAIDSLETQMLEVKETVAELEERVDEIDEAIEDVETLEKVEDKIEEEIEEGGMTESTAEMAEIAVESIYRRLGIKRTQRVSMESFGNTSTRMDASQIALESVREGITKAWEAIKAAVERSIDWVTNFVKQIFEANARMRKRAEGILRASRYATGEVSKETIKVKSLAQNLSMGGQFDISMVSTGLENVAKVIDDLINSATNTRDIIENLQVNDDGTYNFNGDVERMFENILEKANMAKSEELPGNRAIQYQFKSLKILGKEVRMWSSVTIVPFEKGQAKPKSEELPVADANEIKNISQAVIDIANMKDPAKREGDQAVKTMKKAVVQLSKVTKAIKKSGGTSEDLDLLKVALPRAVNYITRALKLSGDIGVSIGKPALDYCEQSLKQYSENQKEIRKSLRKEDAVTETEAVEDVE